MIMRPEHPNPQLERQNWLNLNGKWQFAFDFGNSGTERRLYEECPEAEKSFDREINVPFCPESKLSGIEYKDFIPAVWYKRKFGITEKQLSGRVLIHFGAADWHSIVYINGEKAGEHRGGYSSFAFEITKYLHEGENIITVYAEDDVRTGLQPGGKQSEKYNSYGCMYTRTTGIWQTVWLEFVPKSYVKALKYYPNIETRTLCIECETEGSGEISFEAFYEGRPVGSVCGTARGFGNRFTLKLTELHLWEAGKGRLYDLKISFNGDEIKSYFGMREIKIDGYRFMLNNKPVFLRTVLDQGFYREGIYTAPSDEALQNDIRLSMALGFNGARLHEKMFEPRFLYHADKEGYLVFGEHANWGLDVSRPEALLSFLPEWVETMQRDFSHPAIIGWCPFNETWDRDGHKQIDAVLETVYRVTKAIDPTRPCIDTSGNYHVVTDIYDLHDYEQDVKSFCSHYEGFPTSMAGFERHPDRQSYSEGLPFFMSEYGGIKWDTSRENSAAWGYGSAPKTEEEFIERYRGLTSFLLNHPYIMGFCYTQLFDVEQETNGLLDYDRKPKFDISVIHDINAAPAAIEQ